MSSCIAGKFRKPRPEKDPTNSDTKRNVLAVTPSLILGIVRQFLKATLLYRLLDGVLDRYNPELIQPVWQS